MQKLKKLGIILIAAGGIIGIVVGAHAELAPNEDK